MTSNSFYTWTFKYTLPVATFLTIAAGLSPLLPEQGALYGLLLGSVAIGLLLLWRSYRDKIVRVRVSEQRIAIIKDGSEEQVYWADVERLTQWIATSPPFYRMKIRGKSGYYLFVTQPYFIDAGFGAKDISDMGELIAKKKEELSI